jgi:hypothetical protein
MAMSSSWRARSVATDSRSYDIVANVGSRANVGQATCRTADSCARGRGDRERELRSKIDLLVTGARTVSWSDVGHGRVSAFDHQMVWRAGGGASARYRSAQTFRCGGGA